jgi:hypothetical protein
LSALHCTAPFSQHTLIVACFLARTENVVLSAKVKELSAKVKVLTVENASLLAEVEMYRKEAALPNFSNLALGQASPSNMDMDDAVVSDAFVRSGNGVRHVRCRFSLL